jgi:hypothetical protein
MPVILATWEAKTGRIAVQDQLKQSVCETPISRITRAKWTGGLAQAVGCLLCKCLLFKCKALSSNPSPIKKKKEKKKTKVTHKRGQGWQMPSELL